VGTIDGNSINDLSLVVKMSEHIQISSAAHHSADEVEPEELAKFFPSFWWVVRDF
jgi:hypothetical protein